MVIEESVEIRAPLPVVWDVFSRLEKWEEWNSVCEDCCLIEGREMSRDACFTFTLRPYHIPIKISPRITRCDPGREVIWEGERLGIRARHRFTFEANGTVVRLVSVEEFAGPLLWLSKVLLVPERLHSLSRKLLREIKAQAERCVTG